MNSSPKKAAANRRNSRNSTGPLTPEGKKRASTNALRHGLLSGELLLSDENPDEFAALLQGLTEDLRPVGIYESYLVERIAIGVWRSRRLVRAEHAEIELSQQFDAVRKKLLKEYGYLVGADLSPDQTAEVDEIQRGALEIINAQLNELDDLFSQAGWPHHDDFVARYPYLAKKLKVDAADNKTSDLAYGGLGEGGILRNLPRLAKQWRTEAEKLKAMFVKKIDDGSAIKLAVASQLVPIRADLLARYQTALDNQTERAFRQLMQAQAWRGHTLEVEAKVVATKG